MTFGRCRRTLSSQMTQNTCRLYIKARKNHRSSKRKLTYKHVIS